MSVTLPGDGTVVATVNVGGEQQQVVQVSTLPAITGTVALDAASLAALENVSVGNFPATQPVSGTIALDAGSLAALETVSVANFPATQPVSGTVSVSGSVATTLASQPLPTGAATETTLAAASAKLPASLGAKTAAASLSITPASDAAFVVAPAAATYVNRSGTITAGGTAQVAMALNASRRGFSIQNNSTGDLWFDTLATAVQSQPSFKLPAGALYETPYGGCPTGAVSIIGATTAQAFTAREF